MAVRLSRFLKSLFWHVWAGSPKSSRAEIARRFSICETCEYYNAKDKKCNICGCNISNKKIFMNKLAWADQKCPIEKW
jgi:hypothetical protein